MKRFILVIACLWLSVEIFAQGVNFQNLAFRETLAKAQKENKLIFMDCYTSWCGPCKRMEQEVFTQENVGTYFNEKFISVKYDMEKGEGPELKKRYGVGCFPTFLVLDAQGAVRHKFTGLCTPEELLKQVAKGYNAVSAYGEIEARYQAGDRSRELLESFIPYLSSLSDSRLPEVAVELANTLTEKEKVSKKYWFLYSRPNIAPRNSANFKYFLANYDRFYESLGDAVYGTINYAYMPTLLGIIGNNDPKNTTIETLNEMEKEVKLLSKCSNNDKVILHLTVAKAIVNKNLDKMIKICKKEFKKYSTPEIINYFRTFSMAIAKKGTSHQKEAWCKLNEKLATEMKRTEDQDSMKFYADWVKKHI